MRATHRLDPRSGLWLPTPLSMGSGRRRTSSIIKSRKGHSGFVNPGAGGTGTGGNAPPPNRANEPTGMTPVYPVNPFDATPPYTPGLDGFGWRVFNSENATNNSNNISKGYTVANGYAGDGCTIQAVNGKLRVNYPAGSLGGYDPSKANAGGGFRAVGSGTSKTRLYFTAKVRLSAAWTNAANRSTKLVFVRTEDGDSNHEVNLSLGQAGDGSTLSAANTGFYPQLSYQKGGYGPSGSGNLLNASGFGAYDKDVEHTVECYFVMNTPGTANGIAKIWVTHGLTGVTTLELNRSDINWVAAGQTPGWAYLLLDPTYGGGTNPVPADQYFELDDWYISVGTAVSDYPNKPASITTLRYSFNPADPNNPLVGANGGTPLPNVAYPPDGVPHLDISDGGLRTIWPAGMTAGADFMSPIDFGRDDVQAYQSCYVKGIFILPDPTFTSQQVVSKLCYLRYGSRAQTNAGTVFNLYPGGALGNNTPRSVLQMQAQMSQNLSGGSIPLYPNTVLRANAFWFTTQVPHTVEAFIDVGTVDQHDAIYRLWIDGVLYMDYSPTSPYLWGDPDQWSGAIASPTSKGSAVWAGTWINPDGGSQFKMLDSASGFTTGIYALHYSQIWGGTGGTPATKQQTDHSVLRLLDYFVGAVKP